MRAFVSPVMGVHKDTETRKQLRPASGVFTLKANRIF